MKNIFLLLLASTIASSGASTQRGWTYDSVTKVLANSPVLNSNASAIATAVAPFIGTYVDPAAQLLPAKNRFSVLASNITPWRIGGFGDSLGDDMTAEWTADFGRALGFNGGYLTVVTNSLAGALTYTHSGNVTIPLPDTNWFALHFTMIDTADVTFDSGGRYLVADTFRVAVVGSTNGGTYKIQVATNGGAFTDVTATLSALTTSPTGIVTRFNTNQGEWKLKVVNVTGTNVVIGGGVWASNKGGISPAQMWSFGGTLADVTNVSTNITVPVLQSLGLTEFYWHALDTAALLTNAVPIFCRTLAMAGLAPTNTDGVFIGVNQVTDNSSRYDLGNAFVQAYVTSLGYGYVDTWGLGTTNDLVRRKWVTDGDCVHLNAQGIWYLSDRLWRDGGVRQVNNLLIGSFLGTRVPVRIYPALNQQSNLFEICDYSGYTNIFAVNYVGGVSIGPRSASSALLDVNGSVTVGKTNASTAFAFTRLNSSSALDHHIWFDALNGNTAALTYERDSGRLTLNSGVGIHMLIDADNNQTANAFTVGKDAANKTNSTDLFVVQENGGAYVVAGLSTSNAFVGGTTFASLGIFTNLNAVPGTLTNLGNVSIAAHMMTNTGDRVIATWTGRDAGALANTNNFQIVFGSQTLLDTGLQTSSNFTFRACAEISRTASGQHVDAAFTWYPNGGVTGLPWTTTNVNLEISQTNGIATTLALKGSAQRVGAHTNNTFFVEYKPGPK